ncbi:MAG: hypothetical protein ACOVON_07505 [Sediminibacterium sp.]
MPRLLISETAEEMDTPFNRYEIGKRAQIQPKAVDAICKLLVQANFIKKLGECDVYITPHGQSLANKLLEER